MINPNFKAAEATEEISCPICGSVKYRIKSAAGDYEYSLPGRFFVSECKQCGLLYQNPRPPFSEILRYYTEEYAPYRKVGSPLMQTVRRKFLIEPRLNKYFKLAKAFGRPIDLLDVGCGAGNLLVELSESELFRCQGLEPVEYAVDLARERGLQIHCTTIEEWDVPDEQFDIITMNHVIEHIPDPTTVTERAYRLLRRDGVLVGETPCADSLERIIFGKYWKIYHLPRHLTFFSKKLLVRFLKQIGFRKVKYHLQPVPTSWQGSIRNFMLDKSFPSFILDHFSGQSLLLNLPVVPITYLAAWLGYASIIHFTAYK